MELRHLRYFLAVGEASNFSKAAAQLRVAQPALSRQVRDLEDEIGVELLRRSPRGVRLTAEGRLFLEEVRQLLKRTDESVEKVRALVRGEYSELHVGYRFPTMEILPPALAAFQKAMPGVKVSLHELSCDELIACDSRNSLLIEVEAGHGIALCIPAFKFVTGKRLLYRPSPETWYGVHWHRPRQEG
jgi:DNA-binding transcriptional LysR family regulator